MGKQDLTAQDVRNTLNIEINELERKSIDAVKLTDRTKAKNDRAVLIAFRKKVWG